MPAATSGHDLRLVRAPFQLDGLAIRFFQNATAVFHRLVQTHLVAEKGHICHHQGPPDRAGHHFGVIDDFVERGPERVGMTLHDHRQAVTHQNPFDPGVVQQSSHRVVVGGEHRDLAATPLQPRKLGYGDLTLW